MDNVEQHILTKYARFIAHMRAEKEDHRFGLVFGAGVSQPLGFPSWIRLVDLIASHAEVDGKHVISNAGDDVPASSKTQMLFQHYRTKILDKTKEGATRKSSAAFRGNGVALYKNAFMKVFQKLQRNSKMSTHTSNTS